ncbi:hypothetical protein ASPWEDRAFT_36444 [Aspergillus wentii DTO 134E9]|uniref:FAD-binding PCMH-type domain-containing protein n=1 Tax=Aspergillus wentii DTO 134E9 TaxID=1073089 RepID=A0A1L9RV16_ASPWE|nr:uncharacterized protein ASPWEDRAFT_36444 [Aspergillus wentii DTO 134E9]KAI9928674.1 hypothetical protein MW887_001890 [Aspergillus wentii]OJJ38760.1 hypothetical protein ASPWEDRAFT_36444 [Aspergillus wentii DTO 134E9]
MQIRPSSLFFALVGATSALQNTTSAAQCRCMPNSSCWPSVDEWSQFNSSVAGRLIKTVPLASPCHAPNYNATECQYLQDQWTQPALHDESSSSIMAAAVANGSCDPFTSPSSPCRLGNMVSYAVNVSSAEEIARTMSFAAEKNIRFVIRNTGHDYMGKSSGAGGLSIWTHHLKNITIHDYSSAKYTGPAVTIGAGVQGAEVYAAVHKENMVMVGGECATVGPAGGYAQGGGHSALSSRYGLAADQILEWEVIDGKGRQLRASPTENADLYWALTGGGGGTYGVVTSMTAKIFPEFPVAGVVLEFESDPNNLDPFYEAVEYYHSLVPVLTAAGGMAIARVQSSSFLLTPLTLPDTTLDKALELITPFTDKLDSLNISYAMNLTHSPSYLDHYNTLIEPNPTQLVDNGQYGGKLIPLSVIEQSNSDLTAAMRKITQDGVTFVSIGLNVSSAVAGQTNNSVLPTWRTAAMDVILSTSWPEHANLKKMKQLANDMTNKWVPLLESLTDDRGCYMNEADPQQPNWQEAFYGPNYDRLLSIKQKYDPEGQFYAHTAVGSEKWVEEDDGRLCRAT